MADTPFSRATITASHTAQFIKDMHALGYAYTDVAAQVEALSRQYQKCDDDSDYRTALREAYRKAEQIASYHAVDAMREGAIR